MKKQILIHLFVFVWIEGFPDICKSIRFFWAPQKVKENGIIEMFRPIFVWVLRNMKIKREGKGKRKKRKRGRSVDNLICIGLKLVEPITLIRIGPISTPLVPHFSNLFMTLSASHGWAELFCIFCWWFDGVWWGLIKAQIKLVYDCILPINCMIYDSSGASTAILQSTWEKWEFLYSNLKSWGK